MQTTPAHGTRPAHSTPAAVHTYTHHLLLLLSFKSGTDFTIPKKMEDAKST